MYLVQGEALQPRNVTEPVHIHPSTNKAQSSQKEAEVPPSVEGMTAVWFPRTRF